MRIERAVKGVKQTSRPDYQARVRLSCASLKVQGKKRDRSTDIHDNAEHRIEENRAKFSCQYAGLDPTHRGTS